MPTLEPLPNLYYIQINSERCKGPDRFVLEPAGEEVQLQELDSTDESQKWKVYSIVDDDDERLQWSGVLFENVHTKQSLRYVATGKPLTTAPWHSDQFDPTFAWQLRLSQDEENHPGEASIWAVSDYAVIDATGSQPCHGATALAYGWNRNNNQYWVIAQV
jgi:hypothetical protein